MRLVDEWLSTDGRESKTHWIQAFLPLAQPIDVRRGDVITFHLKRPGGGEWTWDTTQQGKRQRQSTFLAQALKPADLLKKSEQYQPALTDQGRAAQWLLGRIDGTAAVGALADELLAKFPTVLPNRKSALQFVFSLTDKLS